MKRLAFLCTSIGLLCLGGCGVLPNDPAVVDRSERWFRRTDPAVFFVKEQRHDRVYFIGVYDPAAGADSPVPGVPRDDPAYRVAQTWFVDLDKTNSPERNQRFEASAREFARRYNPLVLASLRQHPKVK